MTQTPGNKVPSQPTMVDHMLSTDAVREQVPEVAEIDLIARYPDKTEV